MAARGAIRAGRGTSPREERDADSISVDRSVRIMLSESGKDLLRPWENVETPIGCHSIQDSNKKSERVDK